MPFLNVQYSQWIVVKKPVYCSLAQLTSFHTLRGDKGQILGRLKVFAFDEQMNDIKKPFRWQFPSSSGPW